MRQGPHEQRVLDALQTPQVFRKLVRPRTVAQQREIAKRRIAILFLALGDVGDGRKGIALDVLAAGPELPVAPSRNAFGRIELNELATSDPVKHAPRLSLRIDAQVRRRGPCPSGGRRG